MGLSRLSGRYRIKNERQVLITEVTRMSNGLICVAGLDIHEGVMVRPLTSTGSNWEEANWANPDYMAIGNILSLVTASPGNLVYPHANEDFRVSRVTSIGAASPTDLYEACLETADKDVESIFDDKLRDGKYVLADVQCRSLGCIMLPRRKIRVHEYYNKVQVSYLDKQENWHNFPVTDLATKNSDDAEGGVSMLEDKIAPFGTNILVALRLGLARAWDGGDNNYNPKRCYVQINGIIVPE